MPAAIGDAEGSHLIICQAAEECLGQLSGHLREPAR